MLLPLLPMPSKQMLARRRMPRAQTLPLLLLPPAQRTPRGPRPRNARSWCRLRSRSDTVATSLSG